MKVVNKNIEVRIYPSKADKNDKEENIVSINKIESNIGISRFIYNHELAYINDLNRYWCNMVMGIRLLLMILLVMYF